MAKSGDEQKHHIADKSAGTIGKITATF